MLHVVSILFGAIFTTLVSWSAGKILLSRLQLRLFREEQHLFAFVCGSACFSLAVFILCAAHLVYVPVLLAVGAVIVFTGWRTGPFWGEPLPPLRARWWWIPIGFVPAIFGAVYFVNALAPETSSDGSQYHLGVVALYLRHHGFERITTNALASFPEGIEMLFLSAFAFGRHSAASMVEFSYLLALPVAILAFCRRSGFPKAGVFAAVAVFLSPVFGATGTVAYVDVAGAYCVFCVFYVLEIWDVTRQSGLLPLAGLLAGFCFAIKYSLFPALIYAAGFVIWRLWATGVPRRIGAMFRPLSGVAAGAALMIVPWLGKNWIFVSNPFAPFLNRYFPNPYITIAFEKSYIDLFSHLGNLSLGQRILGHIVTGNGVESSFGPLFLLAPLALGAMFPPVRWWFGRRRRSHAAPRRRRGRLRYGRGISRRNLRAQKRTNSSVIDRATGVRAAVTGRRLLLAALLFALPAGENVFTRFLMASLPFVAVALGMVAAQVPGLIPVLLMVHAGLSWPLIDHGYGGWQIQTFPIKEALRITPEAEVLETRLPYKADLMIDRLVPKDGHVFATAAPPIAYTSRDVVTGWASAEGSVMLTALATPNDTGEQPVSRLTFTFPAQALQKFRVVQTASHPVVPWSITELRIFQNGRELDRSPEWRVRALPNPWYVQLAFDNNPATSWQTGDNIHGGEWVEVDMRHPRQIDSVAIEGIPQVAIRLQLQTEQRPGVWRTLVNKPAVSQQALDWNLRRAATLALRSRGFNYLLLSGNDAILSPTDSIYADVSQHPGKWGVELLGEADGRRLYRIR